MTDHLTPEKIAEASAGLELDRSTREHLSSCVSCRSEVAAFEQLVAARRAGMTDAEPDWDRQAAAVMARLPVPAAPSERRRMRWLRPVLAAAAAVLVAVAVGVLRPDRPSPRPVAEPGVEEILAETNELLSDNRIPGFEAIDPGVEALTAEIDNGAS
jgi:hypothetical protein